MKKLIFVALITISFLPAILFALPWVNGQSANLVIGQPDFVSYSTGHSINTLYNPTSTAIDYDNNKLYVCDNLNNRILRFNYPIISNQPDAEMVFGQANFTNNSENRGSTMTSNSLRNPSCVYIHNGNLWVVDAANFRVLRWSNAYSATIDASADLVLGSSNFVSFGSGISQNRFSFPGGLCFDNSGNLWVSDNYNNRVLMFANAESKSNGANADKVLGQTTFSTRVSTVSQSGFNFHFSNPYTLITCMDNTLWVSDLGNNRVLRFDNASSKSNGANADGVLGQDDFFSSSANRGGTTNANTLYYPIGLYADQNTNLYVVDYQNNRVLIFENASSKSNGADADFVLGQTDFVSSTHDLSANKFPTINYVTGDKNTSDIFVNDYFRVLRFSPHLPAIPVLPVWGIITMISLFTIILYLTIRKVFYN